MDAKKAYCQYLNTPVDDSGTEVLKLYMPTLLK